MGEEYPCPVLLRTGCYPDEEFQGLLHSALLELQEQLALEQPGSQPLVPLVQPGLVLPVQQGPELELRLMEQRGW